MSHTIQICHSKIIEIDGFCLPTWAPHCLEQLCLQTKTSIFHILLLFYAFWLLNSRIQPNHQWFHEYLNPKFVPLDTETGCATHSHILSVGDSSTCCCCVHKARHKFKSIYLFDHSYTPQIPCYNCGGITLDDGLLLNLSFCYDGGIVITISIPPSVVSASKHQTSID